MIATVVVHGVGLWPGTFRAVADGIGARTGAPVELWTRPPYRGSLPAPALPFAAQVRALAAAVAASGRARVVGVSGGATLALSLAIEASAGRLGDDVRRALVGIVTHEPLVGALEPVLDDRVGGAGATLAADPSVDAALGFCRGLYGPGWDALGPDAHDWAAAHHGVICAEVAEFAGFQPSEADLGSIEVPHLTTVGARSAPERHRIACLLGDAGARSVVLPDCGHLVHVDAPGALVDVATSSLLTPAPSNAEAP